MAGSDAVWRRVFKTAVEMRTIKVQVGVLSGQGGETTEDGITMVELAAIHEFGSPAANIPERSFIRRTFVDRVPNELARVIAALTRGVVAEKLGVRQAVGQLGAWGAAQVKNTITQSDVPPPLAASTIARKGSSKPLVDTGHLVGAITWKVTES